MVSVPMRHGTDRLDTAEAIDFIGAGHIHRDNDRRRDLAVERRRRGDDALHAGDFRGHHAHVRGSQPADISRRSA